MKHHIWNYVVNKNVLNKPEYLLYFRFFEVTTFCFAHSWHSLNQIHEEVNYGYCTNPYYGNNQSTK